MKPSQNRAQNSAVTNLTAFLGRCRKHGARRPVDLYVRPPRRSCPIVVGRPTPGPNRTGARPDVAGGRGSVAAKRTQWGSIRPPRRPADLDWIVDPLEPRLTVHRLVDGRFVEQATVAGDERYAADDPFSVEVIPAALVT